MDFQLTDEQKTTQRMVRDLAIREIVPIAAEIDESGRFPSEAFEKIAEAGLFGVIMPPAFGGAGGTRLDFALTVEALAIASASVGWCYMSSVTVGFLILAFGSDAQKQKYLPDLAQGKKMGAFALVEPSGGTNWQRTMQTRATDEGDHYLLNGAKCFTSNAGEADLYIVFARTDPMKGPMGISTLILEKGMPGFSFGRRENKLGLRSDPTGELIFDACRVPKENRLGGEGAGLPVFRANGGIDCLGHAAVMVGTAQAALDASVKYVTERTVGETQTLAHFENVQRAIADMSAAVETARLLAYRAALKLEAGEKDPLITMSAMYGNQVAIDVTSKAVELHGGYGSTKDFQVERYFRDAKTISLQKTSEFVRTMVGKMILGIQPGPPPGK